MANLPRKQNMSVSGGIQVRTTPDLALPAQVIHSLNAEFSTKIGSATGRQGSAVQSTVVSGQQVLNIMQWIKNDGTTKYLVAISDGAGTPLVDIYVNAAVLAGAWSKSLEDLTDAKDVFSANFINQLVACNGVDAPKMWDGTTWTAIANAPADGHFPEVFMQRLFMLTEKGYLWYSDTVSSTGEAFTTNEWLSRGINPNDGQLCKMLIRHRGRLVILKEESIYRYNGTNEPEADIHIGTYSGKSVVSNGDLYFHSPSGIHRLGAGEPVNVSRAVQKFIDGMSSANWENVAGGKDLNNVYFWIGDVTIDDPLEHDYGKTYTDVVLVHDIYAQTWTVYSGWNARTWFNDKTTGETYFGTADGKVVRINTGYADVDGSIIATISFELIFMPEDYGYPEKEKEFGTIEVIGQYESDILIADNYEQLVSESHLNRVKGAGNFTCKELWVGVAQEYEKRPPRINGLIIDNVTLHGDAK